MRRACSSAIFLLEIYFEETLHRYIRRQEEVIYDSVVHGLGEQEAREALGNELVNRGGCIPSVPVQTLFKMYFEK